MYRFILIFIFAFASLFGAPLDTLFKLGGVQNAEEAQETWIQKGDRWTFQNRYESKREEILDTLSSMGWFEAKHASKNHYQYGVVLGSLYASVQKRMNYLVEEWNRGVRFDTIVFLTGKRPLHPTKEKEFKGTETTMMLQTWDKTEMPQALRDLPLVVVDAPPIPERGRPTTESTLYAWLEKKPDPDSSLFFSNQPYVHYQQVVIQSVLPRSFKVETVGPKGGENLPTSVLLDNVGKWLYWKNVLLNRSS